jgi:hypothetical protein
MKKLTKEQRRILDFAWRKRLTLRAKGDKLYQKGGKLRDRGTKYYNEGAKFHAKGDKHYIENLTALVGNIKMEWVWRDGGFDCKLETGDVFRHDALRVEK